MFANDRDKYGWFSILLHWSMAILTIGLFGLGLYMVGLDYYDAWYNSAPHIHESIGVLLGTLLLVRLIARLVNPPPAPLPSLRPWERRLAVTVHWLFYLLLFCVVASGYLISTAGGNAIAVFNWFELPAVIADLPQQEDIAGVWHDGLAWALLILAGLHALASLKHHFIDRDASLRRILGFSIPANSR